MLRSDKTFVREQIAASKYGGPGHLEAVFIKSIIDALDRYEIENEDDDKIEGWIADAISLFRGQPIVEVEDGREWADFTFGEVGIRDTVRVRPNAYSGESGRSHNGRVGIVVGTQGRRFSVRYEDTSQSPIGPILHEHTALQRLVK